MPRNNYQTLCIAVCLAFLSVSSVVTASPDAFLPDGGEYFGEIKDGLLHGEGRIEYKNGARYQGHFKHGYMHGQGRFSYSDGDTYEGDFRQGLMHGQGTYTTAYGDSYAGEFFEDQLSGKAKISFPKQNIFYEGEVKDWQYDGLGILDSPEGTYDGSFKDGLYHGKGRLSYADGGYYEGEFADGKMHGKGIIDLQYAVYEGTFVEGAFSGEGKYSEPDGASYKGSFENWVYQGQGALTDAQGNIYEGTFSGGSLTGVANYKGIDGEIYAGEFSRQKYQGKGHLIFPDGSEYRGEFSRGKYHGQGKLVSLSENGEKSVQEGLWEEGYLIFDQHSGNYTAMQAELALEHHQRLLEGEISTLSAGDIDRIDTYFLGFAGDGTQGVFQRELEFVESYFEKHMGSSGRTVSLINGHSTAKQYPMATAQSLETALSAIAEKMDFEQDILFMYLSSHGGEDHDLLVDHDSMKLQNLSAQYLADSIAKTGIKWKVIFVSACFAGGFIPYLKDDHTLVLTAADADNSSFGCSDDSEMTYFGKALFKEVLGKQPGMPFDQAFEKAKGIIAKWENEKSFTNSNPAIHKPEEVLKHLDAWRDQNSSK